MKTVQFSSYGGPEVLELAEVDDPIPGSDDCLVEIEAAGVNPLDWKIRSGEMRLVFWIRRPYVPGSEISGRVVKCGEAVTDLEVGDPVVGFVDPRRGGAYAERVVLPREHLHRKPSAASWQAAAGLPIAGVTALQALRDHAAVGSGDRVLVNGASGGVGHLAVQVAKHLGARVTGVCSADNLEWVTSLGADETIDYREVDFTSVGERWDVIFDVVANRSYRKCRDALTARGTYLNTLPTPVLFLQRFLLPLVSRRRVFPIVLGMNAERLAAVCRLVEDGQLAVHVDRVLGLEEAREAQRISEGGHVRGKLVLTPAP